MSKFPLTDQSNKPVKASKRSDGSGMQDVQTDMAGGGSKGKGFLRKYSAADMMQALRRRKMGA